MLYRFAIALFTLGLFSILTGCGRHTLHPIAGNEFTLFPSNDPPPRGLACTGKTDDRFRCFQKAFMEREQKLDLVMAAHWRILLRLLAGFPSDHSVSRHSSIGIRLALRPLRLVSLRRAPFWTSRPIGAPPPNRNIHCKRIRGCTSIRWEISGGSTYAWTGTIWPLITSMAHRLCCRPHFVSCSTKVRPRHVTSSRRLELERVKVRKSSTDAIPSRLTDGHHCPVDTSYNVCRRHNARKWA